jgi:ankyrin repeat protein
VLSRFSLDLTFFHFALLADAPRVAIQLMKNGADISQEIEDYPDLTPLYMALPRSLATGPTKFDLALRIACSYALPRTATFLLASGANVNTTNSYGIAAIHTVVMRRHPWRELPLINFLLSREHSHPKSRWENMLLQTVSALLDFDVDINLQSQASRMHECDNNCWRSIDCDHQSQMALHFASANGIPALVSRLLDAGADPNMPNGQGYTALYCALVQGHRDVACRILERSNDTINPIVNTYEETTALHVACRFSFTEVVRELLRHGADANVSDSQGRTPLHDALTWAHPDRERELLTTLECLVEFHADLDTTAYDLTPRRIAEMHFSARIRDIFSDTQTRTQVRRLRPLMPDKSNMNAANHTSFSGAKRKVEPLELPRCPIPQQMDFNLENSVWAPHNITQLGKSFKESPKSVGLRNSVVIHEPFPNLITKPEGNAAKINAPVKSVWSETGTAQIVRGLEVQALQVDSPQDPQQHLEVYPVLPRSTENKTRTVVQGSLNAEASHFWGNLRIARPKTGIGDGHDRAVITKSKRRWKPFQLE